MPTITIGHLEEMVRSARSLTWWLLTPFNLQQVETALKSTHRCLAFMIPFTMPLKTWERLQNWSRRSADGAGLTSLQKGGFLTTETTEITETK